MIQRRRKITCTKKEEKTHQRESNLNFDQCQNVYFIPQFCMCTKNSAECFIHYVLNRA